MFRRLFGPLVAVVMLAGLVLPTTSALAASPDPGSFLNESGVPAGSVLCMNITYKITNDEDSGNVGHGPSTTTTSTCRCGRFPVEASMPSRGMKANGTPLRALSVRASGLPSRRMAQERSMEATSPRSPLIAAPGRLATWAVTTSAARRRMCCWATTAQARRASPPRLTGQATSRVLGISSSRAGAGPTSTRTRPGITSTPRTAVRPATSCSRTGV